MNKRTPTLRGGQGVSPFLGGRRRWPLDLAHTVFDLSSLKHCHHGFSRGQLIMLAMCQLPEMVEVTQTYLHWLLSNVQALCEEVKRPRQYFSMKLMSWTFRLASLVFEHCSADHEGIYSTRVTSAMRRYCICFCNIYLYIVWRVWESVYSRLSPWKNTTTRKRHMSSLACSESCDLLCGGEIELAVGAGLVFYGHSLSSLVMTFDLFQPYCIRAFCCTDCSGAHLFSLPFRLRSRRYHVETSNPEKHCLR
jgi:hypothetical protein